MSLICIRKVIVFSLLLITIFSCRNGIIKKVEYDAQGRLHKVIFTDKAKPEYQYVETYDSTGFCTEKAEYRGNVLNGKRIVNNPLSGSLKIQFYVNGHKHGIERMATKENSHEMLFINDTLVILKAFGEQKSNIDTNMVIGSSYGVYRCKGIDQLIKEEGEIYLRKKEFVSIYDLKRDHIDMSYTYYFFDNLSDTIPHGSDIDFDIDLTADTLQDGSRYLYSEIAFGELSANYSLTKISDIYRTQSRAKLLKCKINVPEIGYKLITGIIAQTYIDKISRDTMYTHQAFYKEVYVK